MVRKSNEGKLETITAEKDEEVVTEDTEKGSQNKKEL